MGGQFVAEGNCRIDRPEQSEDLAVNHLSSGQWLHVACLDVKVNVNQREVLGYEA